MKCIVWALKRSLSVFKYNNAFLLLCLIFSTTNYAYAANVDPTRPFGQTKPSNISSDNEIIVLESIIHGAGIHTAVISGKVLKVFDSIGEYQLTAINTHSVILRSKTERLKLNVFKSNIVKVSATK